MSNQALPTLYCAACWQCRRFCWSANPRALRMRNKPPHRFLRASTPQQLDPLVVTIRVRTSLSEAPASVTIVTERDIEQRRCASGDVVSEVPVHLRSKRARCRVPSQARPKHRGCAVCPCTARTLVMIDGSR